MQTFIVLAGKVVIVMVLLLACTLVTGRRKIAQLPVFDFLTVIVLGAVAGSGILDPKLSPYQTGFAIILIVALQYLYSLVLIKDREAGKLLTFKPMVLIENGQMVKSNMRKSRYTIDNVLSLLREKDVFDLNEVEFAVLESNGQLSVLKKSQYQPVTPKEIKLNTGYKGLSIPVIVEGEINSDNLDKMGLGRDWLDEQLKKAGIKSEREVFFAAVNTEGCLYISKGVEGSKDLHDMRH